jgi:biopolymer transport protein TolR
MSGGKDDGTPMMEMNTTPLIDVMLVLLVIFMITAPLINPGQIELPSVGKTSDPAVQPMEVSIQADGTLLMRDRAGSMQERRITRDELIAAIRQKQKQNPGQAVVIAADKDVRYEAVLEVMDMLQQNHVAKVGLLAKPRGQ